MWASFFVPGVSHLRLALIASVIAALTGGANGAAARKPAVGSVRSQLLLMVKMTVWTVFTILAPILMFPAFAQEVNLHGMGNFFFLAMPLAMLAGYGVWKVAYFGHSFAIFGGRLLGGNGAADGHLLKPWIAVGRLVAIVGICLALVGNGRERFDSSRSELGYICSRDTRVWDSLYDIRRYGGEFFMTNINVPTVGFLAAAPGFGVCGPDSVRRDGGFELHQCKTAFVRRYGFWSQQRPRYFYYFSLPALFPGFADCMPSGLLLGSDRGGDQCMHNLWERLASQYALVMRNDIVSVFDLSQAKP